jgi:hypothetical protein
MKLVLASFAAAAALMFAAISGSGAPAASAQYQYPEKVVICHVTGSKTNPRVTIVVSRNAVPAHLRHGDRLGAC